MFTFIHKSSASGKMVLCVFIVNYYVLTVLAVNTRSTINGPSVKQRRNKTALNFRRHKSVH